jgi:hypothetical protein
MSEISVPRPARHDQPVVWHAPLADQDLAGYRIDARHATEQDRRVALAPQDTADRLRDVGGRQARRRDLVEQRLEQMVVAPIDQGDLHLLVAERHRCAEAAEPGADDHDPRHLPGS